MCHTDDSRAPGAPHRGSIAHRESLELVSDDGTRSRAYLAVPADDARAGVVILPDVRGLHPFYEDLAVRFAEAGFRTLAIDYFGRTAGTATRDETFDWKAHVEKVTPAGVAADVRAAIARLRSSSSKPGLPIFTVGFCFGGSSSWRQSGEGHGLAGCIGFYGGRPMQRAGPAIPTMQAPLLMLLAGADQGTPASEFEEFASLVRARGLEVESHTYPGAPHSYFDRSFAEHQDACEDSWRRILAFTARHSGGPARSASP
ncbi:MAG TPA: dienelactone hydrolase family protein [Thermoplasmata archaeon]|nr:dienelactone hydrolase family protein [Thermoplasmata archaeon]